MTSNQTIFVVDDDSETCEALSWLFRSVDFNVETYCSAVAFLDTYDPTRQGCLILDVRMPIMSGLELLDILRERQATLPILMITGHGDIPMAVRAMKAGASDFILKPIDNEHLLAQISEYLTSQAIKAEPIHDEQAKRLSLLTDRERQVMELIVEGKLNKEIAYELTISLSTVEAHRSRIMHKLQVKNLAQLIRFYLQSTVA